ncbi:hypothetical protein HYPSUDRAFT_206867 [Hypholoma sublateritium FD-334 SS-4]|uniref:Major facilitator superfamily (MFS) profile domain-containing protein n=1 Tax=Hypholoma sublateritium (strain FD-334 SS-4) TaxID=945553 RepID=A0A0D2KQ10_HYPSF|nr:hypothetical protein HYPSUDRAFT_206867 [Hypholoma sublateritium FD-334 SS-4]
MVRSYEDNESDEKQSPSDAGHVLGNRRRAALAEVDNAKFSRFHAKICIVAGVGLFTDAYDIFAINIASTMLAYVYYNTSSLPVEVDLGVKVATPAGTVVGQLLFGFLGDVFGRKKIYGIELIVMIIGTFGQALAGSAPAVNIIGVLVAWRFLVGIGIGGDYPSSAVISSEFASTRIRGRIMSAAVAAQGWGNFTASLVAFIITAAFKDSILSSPSTTHIHTIDKMWRLLIGFGALPGVAALYFRLTIPETPRFTMDIERNLEQAAEDIQAVLSGGQARVDNEVLVQRINAPKASWADFKNYFGKRENFKVLFGTAYSWFAIDIAFYGLGLNSGVILQAIGFGTPLTSGLRKVFDNLNNICIGNLILAVAGLIPGYYFTFAFIDKWGRKPIQLMGFTSLTIIFCVLGFGYDKLTETTADTKAFVFLYCLANFMQNFGPNVTVFIVPGEVFPTRYRSTAHGISAACGKMGAVVAQCGFSKLKDIGGPNKFVKHILEIFAFFMLTGVFSTLLIPETMGKSLEELSNEDQQDFVKGTTTRSAQLIPDK